MVGSMIEDRGDYGMQRRKADATTDNEDVLGGLLVVDAMIPS